MAWDWTIGQSGSEMLAETLASEALSDFDKVNLIKQAALRNYLTSHQVKSLLDVRFIVRARISEAFAVLSPSHFFARLPPRTLPKALPLHTGCLLPQGQA